MLKRSLLLALAWMALAPCQAQAVPPSAAPAAPLQERLDEGLLEPAWFGAGPVWFRSWRVDFCWARPGTRWERPTLYLTPWEEPRFLSERDALDYASGWEAAEFLQDLVRARLREIPGLRVATSPKQTPYHAMGRIVEATHIRQGAEATFGIAAGLPTFTWDFKVLDVRTGEVLLASHHRSIWAPAATWVTALELPLRQMAGLPPAPPWQRPAGAQEEENGNWTWAAPDLRLPPGCLGVGSWSAETDTGHLWKAWTNGMGTSLALGTEGSLRARVARSSLASRPEAEPAYLLTGQVFSTPRYLKARYRAVVTEVATGRIVVRQEIRSPLGLPNGICEEVAQRIISHLETLQERTPKLPVLRAESRATEPGHLPELASGGQVKPGPGRPVVGQGEPSTVSAPPATAWEGLDRLVPSHGAVDKAWVSPGLELAGRTLQVADWCEPMLKSDADGYDRHLALRVTACAPAWLYGALASHRDRGFRIQRQAGDIRLEGRVVHLYQPDRTRFTTMVGGAVTFGLSMKAEGILQLRLVDVPAGRTLALVEQELVSLQAASDGIPYKAVKWLAQDLVPWLLKAGCRPGPPASAEPSGPQLEPQGTPEAPPRREVDSGMQDAAPGGHG